MTTWTWITSVSNCQLLTGLLAIHAKLLLSSILLMQVMHADLTFPSCSYTRKVYLL